MAKYAELDLDFFEMTYVFATNNVFVTAILYAAYSSLYLLYKSDQRSMSCTRKSSKCVSCSRSSINLLNQIEILII